MTSGISPRKLRSLQLVCRSAPLFESPSGVSAWILGSGSISLGPLRECGREKKTVTCGFESEAGVGSEVGARRACKAGVQGGSARGECKAGAKWERRGSEVGVKRVRSGSKAGVKREAGATRE